MGAITGTVNVRRGHPWPPAPNPRGKEMDILREVDGQLGAFLMFAVRRVHDWMEIPEEQRESYFEPDPASGPERRARFRSTAAERLALACAEAPELSDTLSTLASVFAATGSEIQAQLAEACDTVSAWAEARGQTETAVRFAEAAATVEPNSPKRANLAGRACRIANLWSRADVWYLRGIGMSRQQKSRKEYFRGHLGAGAVAYLQGRYADARRHFLSGAWKARDVGKLPLAARAQHDLLLLAVETNELTRAVGHARRALKWYPRHHARIPYLVHDYAYLLVSIRQDRLALRLLDLVLGVITAPHERLLVLGTVARAAGGHADCDRFGAAQAFVETMSTVYHQHAAQALCDVARGAWMLELWEIAERVAVRARRMAKEQGRKDTADAAERILEWVACRTSAPAPPALPRGMLAEVEKLALEYQFRMEKWKPRPGETAPPRADP